MCVQLSGNFCAIRIVTDEEAVPGSSTIPAIPFRDRDASDMFPVAELAGRFFPCLNLIFPGGFLVHFCCTSFLLQDFLLLSLSVSLILYSQLVLESISLLL